LAAFAEQGLIGSDAGTSFKSMLQRLTPQSAEAQRRMQELGISAYDASGNFVGLAEFAGNLQGALRDLTPEQRNSAMATIFGSDAVRAAGVLYSQGERGIRDWTAAVNDQGYASETAAMRLDNLKGDLEELGGAFETALIQSGSAANDTLRTMTQAATGLIGVYNDLPEGVQATTTAVGAATSAVALAGGAALLAVPQWAQFRTAVDGLGWSMKGVAGVVGITGLALGGLVAIVGALASEHQQARQKAQAYADTLEEGTYAITDATRDLIAENINAKESFLWLETSSMADAAKDLGLSLSTVREAIEGDADALDELNNVTQEAIDGYNFWNNESIALHSSAQMLRDEVEKETGALGEAAQAARDKAAATEESADSAQSAAESYMAEADAVEDLSTQMLDLINTINTANGISQSAIDANARYQSALAGLSDEVERNGTSLDVTTEAGSSNAAMLADLAGAAQDAATAQFEQDQATMSADEAAKKYYDTLVAQREAFINSATAAGLNADEVKALADQVFALPTEREIQILAETAAAQNAIDRLVINNSGRRITITADVNYQSAGGITVTPGYSTGGRVRGPGSTTSDSILARLSDGEHVLTAAEVQAMGGHDAVEDWRAMAMSGAAAYTPEGPEVVITISVHRKEKPLMLTEHMTKHKEFAR
jgi:DNA-binding transcriptional MerR regulator